MLSDAANRRSFSTASLAQRALIYAAGPFLNLVLAAIDFVAIDFEGGGSAFVSLDMRLEVLIGAFSASVGLFNLLTILPLDGGRLLLIAFEAVRGRRVGEREEKRLLRIGLSVLASTTGVSVLFLFKVIG